MKGIRLLLAVLLAPLAFQAAVADDASDIARAATRKNTTGTVTTTRQKGNASQQKTPAPSRTTNSGKSGTTTSRERATTTPRDVATTTRTTKTPEKNVSARTATNIQPRTIKTVARSTTQPRATTTARVGTTRGTIKSRTPNIPTATRARTATATATTDTDVLSRDFSKCRTVFFDCMDEFCANKDSQLKRCACSSRIHEFDSTKRNLANVEEKLLDFSQRLLTVNMDKEDAAALYKPTEGELAYNTQDTSASKKLLDEIAKKLNTSFNDSNFDQGLNAISLSLNMDSAFDTLDSMAGASTTTKSGTDLYVSALPVCREMAMEVCSADDLAIAESSYQMAIETDCNTVKKSYQAQVDQAHQQVFESGALLDMSRLDIHQKRNSDDILTCKHKMLDMLTDSTVCGDDMGKCLDTTGQYIDPTTGSAFLTMELANLSTLIKRPESGQTWRTAPGNDRFVTFLNSKKKFLEPAMEHCQDISDYVWDEFIEDALAQIKLAQEAKLEEMRQSCTTLTTQCLDETYDSISEFDSRALSIFGVSADRTVNAMCADVQNACTALMKTSGGAQDWQSGMTEIATDKTYETILQTCREVGRACIIQACTSTSGNFGLCENIDTSINRKSIINRTACWDEVVACVASAGTDSLTQIQALHTLDAITTDTDSNTTTRPNTFRTFYGEMYNINDWMDITITTDINYNSTLHCIRDTDTNCVHDICTAECANAPAQSTVPEKCYICRLAERIWGNCEAPSNTELTNRNAKDNEIKAYHNRIKTSADTLLSWFAQNTGTANESDSCRDTSCRPGFVFSKEGICADPSNMTTDGSSCPQDDKIEIATDPIITNCCLEKPKDYWGNCCDDTNSQQISSQSNTYFGTNPFTDEETNICVNSDARKANFVARYEDNGTAYNLICTDTISWNNSTGASDTIKCNGNLLLIDDSGHYSVPEFPNNSVYDISSYYMIDKSTECVRNPQSGEWQQCDDTTCNPPEQPNHWKILHRNICAPTRAE